jgi:hypothetical protein
MGLKKFIRFEAIKAFNNVLEYPENMQGNWLIVRNNILFFNDRNTR